MPKNSVNFGWKWNGKALLKVPAPEEPVGPKFAGLYSTAPNECRVITLEEFFCGRTYFHLKKFYIFFYIFLLFLLNITAHTSIPLVGSH